MTEMTGEIVVGYDGSPGSELALHWAAREASDRGARLTICHAWAPQYLDLAIEPPLLEVQERHGEEIVRRAVERAEAIVGPDGVDSVLVSGSPAWVLCDRSATAEMVVVGSRGHGRLAGLLVGSVAWQVAGHARGRTVIVRDSRRQVSHMPGSVVVGVDGSASAHAALQFAAEEAALRHVPLIAVCALADAPRSLGGARQMEEDFTALVTRFEKEHPDVTVLPRVANSSPRTALLDAATEARLLVVGSRGKGGVPGMALGSVASAVLHHADCPVGIVRTA